MVTPTRSVYTPTDFVGWRDISALELTPKFQRRGVWKRPARSFFIDTLLRGYPVPPIYIRVNQAPDKKKVIREVIDGQQRISAVLDFMDGGYRLSKNLRAPWANKTFEQLEEAERDRIRAFTFSTEVFQGISDSEVLELFSRLNTYSVPLNNQELRNGKFFGPFKQCVYALALQRLEFWRKHQVFTERNIARMLEVEFVSEVVVAQIAGMQDKKKSLDSFYEKYEESFTQQSQVERRFNEVVDTTDDVFSAGDLKDSEFGRVPLLYTFLCVIYHHLFGLPGITTASAKKALSQDEKATLRDAAQKLSDFIETSKDGGAVPASYREFVAACVGQTDNLKPRQERFRVLYKEAF